MAATAADMRGALRATGEVGRDLLAVDWVATPLGPPERWPQSLQQVVRILLSSRFAMWMAWGPELTFFCNDAYRRDTLGTKYPWALGRAAREVWAEIWPDIGPRIETVMRTGVATWEEALLLFLERSGYVEETYHTFSYSPLTGDDGRIAGMLCVVSEDTERVIGERRMATLRDLGSDPTTVRMEEEALATAERHLAGNPRSLPFTLTYLFGEEGAAARLATVTGVPRGHAAAPDVIEGGDPALAWPAADLAAGAAAVVVDGVDSRFPGLPTGGWREPPTQALVVPLPQQGQVRPYGFLVAGLNRYRPLDDTYRGFVSLVAGQVAAMLASARAYETERRRAETLAELDRAKTAFFTNVSHELRTPLTLLLGPAEDALADLTEPLPPAQRQRVEAMHRNAQRLLKLVNTLLDFSRLESGTVGARYEPLDLASYTAELASMFESAVARAGLRLEIDCPPLPEPVYADREMWAKIVFNLVSNALKFTFDGAITVRLRADGDAIELTVADTGIGIDPRELPRLFERFRRVSGARARTYEGSGIGLALVAELAELHGGSAAVESAPGEGTRFTIRLPLGAAHLPAEDVADAPAGPPAVTQQAEGFLAEAMRWLEEPGDDDAAPALDGDRPRVLVADDNADMRDYIGTLLSGSYVVETVPDGAVALERARADPPDLVLTDVMMPNLDGFGLLAALQDDPATIAVPVVMISARAGEEGTIEGLEAGADDYLIKPFSARELRARVRANLELDRARRMRDRLERSGALLDQAERMARVGSWEIDVATGAISASDELARQLGTTTEALVTEGVEAAIDRVMRPDDAALVRAALAAAVEGAPLDIEWRAVGPGGDVRAYRAIGELERDADGRPLRLRGSNQDVTEQRAAEQALAAIAGEREAAERERRIADELQRSLLPERGFSPDHLEVATFYQPGVVGTQVGGDWYDVIELGAGRTALVIGDVMGRGVRAAAVMGQVRAAVRAYARLDLPPADALEFLDGVVRDLDSSQIVTCLYAVYDPSDRVLTYANAGHLPPLIADPGAEVRRVAGTVGPPLGSGPFTLTDQREQLAIGARLALYTDGLVERRDRGLDAGIDRLAAELARCRGLTAEIPRRLVQSLAADGTEDDVAVLVASVPAGEPPATSAMQLPAEANAVPQARRFVAATLEAWAVPAALTRDAVLLVSEMATNAIIHGAAPIELRLRRGADDVLIEVDDGATSVPRRLRPTPEDEHGRGLLLVAMLSDRWGTRPLREGKSVWCRLSVARYAVAARAQAGY